MRRKLIVATTAGALALGGALAIAVPAVADEEGTSTTREDRIRDALTGLVEDGSITGAQADEVATTLTESGLGGRGGPGGPGPGGLQPGREFGHRAR